MTMFPSRQLTHLLVGLALCFLGSWQTSAQGYVDVLPDEVKGPFLEKFKLILSESRKSNEWEGSYTRYVGETWSEMLVWTPEHGFAAYRDTCSNGPRAWVNFGSAKFDDGILTLDSEQTHKGEHLLPLKKQFTPVKWGHQRWLIPTDQLELFAYAVNSGSWEDYGSFYVKNDENHEDPKGHPEIPSQFKHILDRKPLTAKVLSVGKKPERWYADVTIDAGSDKGVIVGMSFWLTGVNNTNVKISVIEVNEKTAVASVHGVGYSYDYDDGGKPLGSEPAEFEPKPGQSFTSRSPHVDEQ